MNETSLFDSIFVGVMLLVIIGMCVAFIPLIRTMLRRQGWLITAADNFVELQNERNEILRELIAVMGKNKK